MQFKRHYDSLRWTYESHIRALNLEQKYIETRDYSRTMSSYRAVARNECYKSVRGRIYLEAWKASADTYARGGRP